MHARRVEHRALERDLVVGRSWVLLQRLAVVVTAASQSPARAARSPREKAPADAQPAGQRHDKQEHSAARPRPQRAASSITLPVLPSLSRESNRLPPRPSAYTRSADSTPIRSN
jgi:hypothetical protein